MKLGEGKNCFIKNNVTRYVNTTRFDLKALKPLMKFTVPKKHTLDGSKGKFLGVVGSKVRPVGTTKCAKGGVIRVGVKEMLEGSFLVNNAARQPVNEINNSKKGFIPKFEWHGGMR
jgi:hypothetical protein